MSARTHEEIQELLGAYALDALDPGEAREVEEHLEVCPRCRDEVRNHREVAALLGNSGGSAPDGVWDRIAGALEESPPPMRLSLPADQTGTVVPLAAHGRSRGRFVVAAVGAAAAVLIAVLSVQVVSLQDRYDELESALEDDAVLTAANLALVDPEAAKAELTSADGSLTASAVIQPDGTGYLMVHELPELADDRTYQLWGQTQAGLISLGILGSSPNDVVPFQATQQVAALAITEEQAGGVIQSANDPIVAGQPA